MRMLNVRMKQREYVTDMLPICYDIVDKLGVIILPCVLKCFCSCSLMCGPRIVTEFLEFFGTLTIKNYTIKNLYSFASIQYTVSICTASS